MPLVRCTVRNEYGLGVPELYKEANREDPKAVLDGVAVSGLVGILRQLGDLAEFAAEVFHGLQEQVTTTASRSHKLMVRVQGMEAALPPLEKAILAQTSHLHFCYTTGSEWHPRLQNESNHFIYNDLPQFIMDSYEECRDPPLFHLLDKFDTGGPGSCLKRYSDPTFFKRVSVISDEVNGGRRRDRTARKRKKKRSWQKNGEVSRCASVFNGSGRMQFTAPHRYEQSSPAQTVSYTDMTFKSDMEDQSHSIDSRNDSGYIDCVLHPRSSSQLNKQEQTESSSSQLNMQDDDNLDSLNLDNSRAEYDADDFSCLSVQGETAPSTSCVTWDEKTEIVEPEDPNCSEATNMLPTDYCQNKQGLATNTTNIDQADISLAVEHTQLISRSHLDEIESETDNFMDALNTIESESENDMDCQTKREVEQYCSNLNNSVIEDGIHEIMTCDSNHHPSTTFESHTASVSSPNKDMSMNIPNPVLLDRFTDEDFPQVASLASNQYRLPGKDVSDHNHILEGSMSEALTSDLSSSGSRLSQEDPASERVIKSAGVPDQADFCGVQTVQFWTNGGLLGLQPSKPPDYTVLNALNQNLPSEGKISASPSGHRADKDEPSLLIPKVELPLLPEFKMTSTDTIQENDRVFGIGRRLLLNGFRKPLSHLHDEKFETGSYLKSGTFANSNTLPDIIFKEQSVKGSSPPLELMKISFQPTNGFETSKLRLKFPDASHNKKFNSDMFPSFQLVPELSTPLHEDNSDSDDDDTFCRSSPTSDDCLSQHSHSNSEQWDSIGTPESKEHELHDTVLCRISSVESILSALELEGALHRNSHIDNAAKCVDSKNGAEPLHYHPLFEHTSYDDVKSSPQQQIPFNSEQVSNGVNHTPPPPPLPPLQWRVSKSLSNVTKEDKQDIVSDGLISQAFDMKHLVSAVPLEQPKPVSIEHQQIIAEDASVSTIKSKHKLNGPNTGDQTANGMRLDEKDNFLQQIRDKSFNLRRTLTAKPTLSSAPATHVKVTAILEKAIAIRQVVGSDDGEDDGGWSDA